MNTKRDYDLALGTVRATIQEWDPYGLLKTGAPPDEFDSEIASIASQIPRIQSSHDATLVISSVFSSNFEPHLFTPESCSDVGEKLYQVLEAQGLLK
ncbi:MAG: DUF1871 family protein [Tildeniella nuda ZEHNDER 1965/U140]|nr:DUF1871 family protein [Tildeniella nuda ZEHNDER 1965/U140]